MRNEASREWLKKRAEAAKGAIENFSDDEEERSIAWVWDEMHELESKLAAAEQRAAQAERDVELCMAQLEVVDHLEAEVSCLKSAEREAVRECERIVNQFIGYPVLGKYTEGLAKAGEVISEDIRNRWPQHFGGE